MSKTNYKPSDFAALGAPSCSRWGKSEIESIALAYVQAMANDGDTWHKLSRDRVIELLSPEQFRQTCGMLVHDYYQHWFDMVRNFIVDSDSAFSVGGFWNLHRLERQRAAG